MAESRTQNSVRNAQTATIFYFLNLILQFFSRKVFLEYLGSEVLGLNTTAQNLLGFLNLAELGIGTAVAYNLYKPLLNKDKRAVNDIVSIQGWLYSKIAIIVLLGALVLACFFPAIFTKAEVPLWYAYGSFGVLLIGALLSYFINYKQIVLSADQKEYKITYCAQGIKIIKILLQILAVRFLSEGYLHWMILEAVAAIITAYLLDRQVRKEYPWLQPNKKNGRLLRLDYPEITRKTKQVFFHKIGGFVLTQTTPLVIYAFASLSLVAIYGNYMLIVTAVTALMSALLNGIGASVGNLVAEGNKEKIKSVFWELTSFRMWLALIFCFAFYMLADPFMILWIGAEYLLPKLPLTLITTTAFIQMTRTNDIFLSAYGLYQDVWAPIVEASLNIGLSIILGYIFGLEGILSGVLISLILIVCSWKPYFLYSRGFKDAFGEYLMKYGKLLLIMLISSVMSSMIVDKININSSSFFSLAVKAIIVIIVIATVSTVFFIATDRNFKNFIKRIIISIIKNKL